MLVDAGLQQKNQVEWGFLSMIKRCKFASPLAFFIIREFQQLVEIGTDFDEPKIEMFVAHGHLVKLFARKHMGCIRPHRG